MTPNTSSIIQQCAEGIQLFKQLSETEINTVSYWKKMARRIRSEHWGGAGRSQRALSDNVFIHDPCQKAKSY